MILNQFQSLFIDIRSRPVGCVLNNLSLSEPWINVECGQFVNNCGNRFVISTILTDFRIDQPI